MVWRPRKWYPPIAMFDAEIPEINCASIVLILFSIVLAPILRYEEVFFGA